MRLKAEDEGVAPKFPGATRSLRGDRRAPWQRAQPEVRDHGQGKGILPFAVIPEADGSEAKATGRAGLTIVVEALRGYGGGDLVRPYINVKKRERGYSEVEFVEAFLVLLASGGEHLEDLKILAEDSGLLRLLSRELPSPDAARMFLLQFHDQKLIEEAQAAAKAAREES